MSAQKVTREDIRAAKKKYGTRKNAMHELCLRTVGLTLRNSMSWKEIVRFDRGLDDARRFIGQLRSRDNHAKA